MPTFTPASEVLFTPASEVFFTPASEVFFTPASEVWTRGRDARGNRWFWRNRITGIIVFEGVDSTGRRYWYSEVITPSSVITREVTYWV